MGKLKQGIPMKRIRLIHWNNEEAAGRAAQINSREFNVEYRTPGGADAIHQLLKNPVDAFLIDLTRLPAQGRDLGILLRKNKSTRLIPLIFVAGDPDKTRRLKELLPDAIFTNWDSVNQALRQAWSNIPENPVIPESVFAGYTGKTLAQKLGIKSKTRVGLIQAPIGFESLLGILPEGTTVTRKAGVPCDLILWFVKSSKVLKSRIIELIKRNDYNLIWIIWPKKTSTIKSDLTQQEVRQTGLTSGLVDYKICAVDKIWSGLLFTRRKGETNG
jgi:CheY-like chemotaxis protein